MATSPQPDTWATATGERNGRPVIYRYRMNRPNGSDWTSYPYALTVRWPYHIAARNGMPPASDNELQIKFEDAVESISEGVHGYLMLVFTGDGEKEWLFFVQAPESWISALNACLAGHVRYPLEIEHWPDAAWTIWQDFADGVEQ